jgi:hypothetical protein
MSTTTSRKCRSLAKPKAQLYGNLARHGILRVVIEYDGCGDSGCIGDITLFGVDDKLMPMPEKQVRYTTESRVYCEKIKLYVPKRTSRSGPLREAIETWCYDLLELHCPGWEIDDGSEGTVELNVPMKTGTWQHSTRYLATSTNDLEV